MEHSQAFSTIIVALDGSAAEAILAPARALAARHGATLVLVRTQSDEAPPPDPDPSQATNLPRPTLTAGERLGVMDFPTPSAPGGDLDARATPVRQVEDTDATGSLNILRNELRDAGLSVEHAEPMGDPAEAILSEANGRGADLIVMGNRHRSAWERLFKGSTAERVLRESICPVLVVPLD
jgi:nucleotide-binding universal stress UspA family protein